jgi:hypothetical protein
MNRSRGPLAGRTNRYVHSFLAETDYPERLRLREGLTLLYNLLRKLLNREFGSDLLGGISIITSILLGSLVAARNAGSRSLHSTTPLRARYRLRGH